MSRPVLKKTIETFVQGESLAGDTAEVVLDALIQADDEALIAEVLTAWHSKGIDEDEIYSFARVLQGRMIPVRSEIGDCVDIVGTGGGRAKTFNVSTAAAFVAAGAGVPVAKHGNRAATSSSGSADVLSELGVDPAPSPEAAERNLNEIGICFMFAPNHHRLSPTLAKVRRGLGFPTIFNCVGPLCNPASAPNQLIGVWDHDLVGKMANALARSGTGRSWIVHAKNGLDELAITAETLVAEVEGGSHLPPFSLSPDDFGMLWEGEFPAAPASPGESAGLIRSIFSNEMKNTGAEAVVAINAAAALFIAGRFGSLSEAAAAAVESLRTGAAAKKLKQLSEASRG